MKLNNIKINVTSASKRGRSKKYEVIDYGGKHSRRKIGDIRNNGYRVIIK